MDSVKEFSIKELFDSKDKYIIPMYQRNYAWEEGEITQLIQDIIDYIEKTKKVSKSYYLGTLITFAKRLENEIEFETIDGQQRLTTLFLLLSYVKNKYASIDLNWLFLNLDFESRPKSSDTLRAIYNGIFLNNFEYKTGIKNGYEIIDKILPVKLIESNLSIQEFCSYLFNSVKILRVLVPHDTDLNHYFEIMNNRGEQLEKHEILKAKFLDILSSDKQASYCFSLVWEACCDMERYVQYGFNTDERSQIFSSEGENKWNSFECESFEQISDALSIAKDDSLEKPILIDEILSGKEIGISKKQNEDSPDRFNSVINFSNFLLHVLRVYKKNDIPLDDKRLLDTFLIVINEAEDKVLLTKEFSYNLLKCKFLFDKYIIKREYRADKDEWSLKRLKCYENNKVSYVNTFGDEENTIENQKILMILSMFHVSTPTLVYKHWLNGALNILFTEEYISFNHYYTSLEYLAEAFMFNRFINKEPIDYFEIIYENCGRIVKEKAIIDEAKLTYGNVVNNLVFNYLDYLLWYENLMADKKDPKISNFEFSFRSSVEHYYPQNPLEGFSRIDETALNSFGNLCLVSHSKNSRLSNFMPTAKKEYYKNNTIDSIKQYIMMNHFDTEKWNIESIEKHNNDMLEKLSDRIDRMRRTKF
jgi:hypothetical protein